MPAGPPIIFEKNGRVARILFNRPERLNAIDLDLAQQLADTLEAVERDRDIRVLVVSGNGRSFMAGGDLKELHRRPDERVVLLESMIAELHRSIRVIRRLSIPVVAGVHGTVAGAGIGLALSCDFVIASVGTVFVPAYSRLGASPDGGLSWHLARAVGPRRASEILMLGRSLDAESAMQAGLINRVVEEAELGLQLSEIARELAQGPQRAYSTIKSLVSSAETASLDTQLNSEAKAYLALGGSSDFAEGIRAFVERRTASFE